MKGLLLKDVYMMAKRCRLNLGVSLLFLALGVLGQGNTFILMFPSLMCAMIPVTLIAHDEHDKWDVYAAVMPYSRAQLVSSKYIVGLITLVLVVILTLLAYGSKMLWQGGNLKPLWSLAGVIAAGGLIPPALCLPFIFKLGSEKGRMVYMAVIALYSAASVAAGEVGAIPAIDTPLLLLAAAAIYALSWLVSIRLYQKRQL